MPLNHLGYKVTYHDIRSELPAIETMKRYAAVATWFGERVNDHRRYLNWAANAAATGTRFIILDFIGAPLSGDDAVLVNRFLRHLGLQSRPQWVGDTTSSFILARDPAVVGFEDDLSGPIPGHMVFTVLPGRSTSHLSIDSDGLGSGRNTITDAVVTSAGGGFIQYGFGQIYDLSKQRLKWITNPFAFLERALGRDIWPIPDTTTLAGRRIYFSHIDGDGWNNISEFKDNSGKHYSVSEVVRDRLIRPYPDLPVSIGLVSCDIAPTLGGTARAALIARELFEMRNIEVGSHTHSHPYNWGYYKNYDRTAELALHASQSGNDNPDPNRPDAVPGRLTSRYGINGPQMPRANYVEPFDLGKEVAGALDTSSSLAPPNKKAAIYLWSGNTKPFEAVVAATRAAGVRNMNGGDTRLDSLYPSVSYVPPISRPVGNERQIYAVNSNENTYTSGWSQNFGAQATVLETWANTDSPRRLKGMNVYYHMYSGGKMESTFAIQTLLDHARKGKVVPITASHYAAIADSFFDVVVKRESATTWRILNRGALDTVRFDNLESRDIDISRSEGVLGSTRHSGALYVALDPAFPEPLVALAAQNTLKTTIPTLADSRWQISALNRTSCGFAANTVGFGRGDMTWRNLPVGRYNVSVSTTSGENSSVSEVATDESGTLDLALDVDAIASVRIEVTCIEPPAVQALSASIPAQAEAAAIAPYTSNRVRTKAKRNLLKKGQPSQQQAPNIAP